MVIFNLVLLPVAFVPLLRALKAFSVLERDFS